MKHVQIDIENRHFVHFFFKFDEILLDFFRSEDKMSQSVKEKDANAT